MTEVLEKPEQGQEEILERGFSEEEKQTIFDLAKKLYAEENLTGLANAGNKKSEARDELIAMGCDLERADKLAINPTEYATITIGEKRIIGIEAPEDEEKPEQVEVVQEEAFHAVKTLKPGESLEVETSSAKLSFISDSSTESGIRLQVLSKPRVIGEPGALVSETDLKLGRNDISSPNEKDIVITLAKSPNESTAIEVYQQGHNSIRELNENSNNF